MIYSVSCGHHDPFRFARDPDTALIQELDVLSHPPPGPSRMSRLTSTVAPDQLSSGSKGSSSVSQTSVSAHTNSTGRERLRSADEQHKFSSRQEDDDNAYKGWLNQLTCPRVAA